MKNKEIVKTGSREAEEQEVEQQKHMTEETKSRIVRVERHRSTVAEKQRSRESREAGKAEKQKNREAGKAKSRKVENPEKQKSRETINPAYNPNSKVSRFL